MTPFEWILLVCIIAIALSLLSGLVLILRTRDQLTRAVLSDLVFYSMVLIYLIWTIPNDTMIDYEVAILGALVAGALPTLSMSRVISRGRR